ncbi:MAG: hypothetical protein WAM77_24640, partial [Xanthobacteraceae bacterium]
LEALAKALNNVDMTATSGRSNIPMLQFASRENVWTIGQKKIVVDNDSTWAVNPTTFKRGWIAFNDNNKPVGEHLVSVSLPMPDKTELPDKGSAWQEQWTVNMKCTTGTDAGAEVVYKPSTVGGIQAIGGLIEAVRDRINGGQHDNKIAPIVRLERDSYQHPQYGRIWTPMLTIVDWMSLDGPAPASALKPASSAPKPASSASKPEPAEQPRRRRITA